MKRTEPNLKEVEAKLRAILNEESKSARIARLLYSHGLGDKFLKSLVLSDPVSVSVQNDLSDLHNGLKPQKDHFR